MKHHNCHAKKCFTRFLFLSLLFLLFSANTIPAASKEYIKLPGVIHVHSQFSSGTYPIETLARKANTKGIEVLILTDHDLVAMEYGVPPLRNIIKKREERKSVLKTGPAKYLAEIERINREQDDVLLIPGVQSSPFYYWTGNPVKKNLTAHEYRKELLLLGMDSPEDYEDLPVMHRGFSTSHIRDLFPRAMVFVVSLVLGMVLLFRKGMARKAGAVIGFISVLFLINHHPFQSSRFDPYHGDQGITPYQELIDYVKTKNGLVFWAHPESNYSRKGVRIGPVLLKTGHYADDLILARDYTGFSALYGDTVTIVNPGRQWDRLLNAYCRDQRNRPVWGIGGSDFHVEKKGHDIDTFQTVLLVEKKSRNDVLDALSRGRCYAMRKFGNHYLAVNKFRVRDRKSDAEAVMGQELNIKDIPVVSGRIDGGNDQRLGIELTLIRGGRVWQSLKGETPMEFFFEDREWKGKKTYYRLEVNGPKSGRVISNPIFVMKGPAG